MTKKVLIIGQGGREHAFAWKIAQSNLVNKIYVCPGNAGTSTLPKTENVNISATDIESLLEFAKNNNVDFTVVGPEAPLDIGITDIFTANSLACFGPNKKGAQIESSKSWCKNLLNQYDIPTAKSCEFNAYDKAKSYLESCSFPQVIKADGLASGKGVFIVDNLSDSLDVINDLLNKNKLGNAGGRIIIEEFLTGKEASYMVMVNGTSFIPLASSQDHKARDNDNKGPNTGGMGAFSPSPLVTSEIKDYIETKIISPTLLAMQDMGIHYTGFLYAGLMLTEEGPKVLEYNARMGDPETQAILFRMEGDFFDALIKVYNNDFDNINLEWQNQYSLNVVMAAKNYPFDYPKGEQIQGLNVSDASDSFIFHAGTKQDTEGNILTNGGRVLNITAKSDTLEKARSIAYSNVNKISWPSAFYRTDIGIATIKP